MEVLRDCQSPIELHCFEENNRNNSGNACSEKQAMIPINDNSSHTNNNTNNSTSAAAKKPALEEEGFGFFNHLMTLMSLLIVIATFPLSMFFCIKVTQEFERAVIFRLGRVLPGDAKGPGLLFIIPCVDEISKVDMRTVTINVPPQEALTMDSVTVTVDAVVYFCVQDAKRSVTRIRNAAGSTKLLAQTTLRNIIGTKSLSEALLDRDGVSRAIQNILDEATAPWGVKVERVEIKDLRLPKHLQRTMAAEAEAAREAKARVVAAEGELRASESLKEASKVISGSSAAIQLRVLQTLASISQEKNSTVVFPMPSHLLMEK
eukprot:gene15704-17288_t